MKFHIGNRAQTQIWLPIRGITGYEVSDWGGIRKTYTWGFKEANQIIHKGYAKISISGVKYFVHRLVAAEFLPNNDNKPFINHLDGNKLNNRASNLEWVDARENNIHSIYSLGNNGRLPIKRVLIEMQGVKIAVAPSVSRAAALVGTESSLISRAIKNGKPYKGYSFQIA